MSVPVFVILNSATGRYYSRKPGEEPSWGSEPKEFIMWLVREMAEAQIDKLGSPELCVVKAECDGDMANASVIVTPEPLMPADHKHWVTVIDPGQTARQEVYNGFRIGVFHDKEEAEADMLQWMHEFFNDDEDETETFFNTAEEAIGEYVEQTNREAKIEECE